MEMRDNKFGLTLLLLIVLAVGGMMRMFGFFDEDSKGQAMPEISYEMPRPKDNIVGDFALSGREIDRQYVNPFEKKPGADKKAVKPAAPNQVKTIAKTNAPTVTSQGTWYKRPQTDVNVVRRDEHGPSGDTPQVGAPGQRPNQANQDNNDDRKNGATGEQRTAGQWRSLLFAEPTKENMDKFVDALAKHQVDSSTFYSVNEELLKSGNAKDETIALYGLNKVGTGQAFVIVARDFHSLPATVQTAAWQVLYSYSAIGRHKALLQAAQTGNTSVSTLAAYVIAASLKVAGAPGNTATTDSRPTRGTASVTASSYSDFRTIITQWASSGNTDLMNYANSILPLLQGAQA